MHQFPLAGERLQETEILDLRIIGLPSAPQEGTKPRLRPALPGPTLGENPLENVADLHALRPGPTPRQSAQAWLPVCSPAHAQNRLSLMPSNTSISRSKSSFSIKRTSWFIALASRTGHQHPQPDPFRSPSVAATFLGLGNAGFAWAHFPDRG